MNPIDLCKNCTNQAFDPKRGIVCGLTNEKPTFESSCPDFKSNGEELKKFQRKLHPNDQRAKAALIACIVLLIFESLYIASSALQYVLLTDIANDVFVSNEEAEANDLRHTIIAALYTLGQLTFIVLFLQWFRRAYFNLHKRVNNLSYSDGWAVGAFFVPIVNLFRPYQIMKELYVETRNFLKSPNVELRTNVIGIWWALWISTSVTSRISYIISKGNPNLNQLIDSTMFDAISGVFGVAALISLYKVIKDYSAVENQLFNDNQFDPTKEIIG